MSNPSSTTRRLLILADSGIVDHMTETAWGPFETKEQAFELGVQKIKHLKWRVAYEVTRKRNGAEDETSYEFLTPIQQPSPKVLA